jgi:hypothetical protein
MESCTLGARDADLSSRDDDDDADDVDFAAEELPTTDEDGQSSVSGCCSTSEIEPDPDTAGVLRVACGDMLHRSVVAGA